MTMATIWISKRSGGRGSSTAQPESGVFIGVSKSKDKAGVERRQLAIAIRLDAMRAMRWTVGDSILVGFDPESQTMTLRRGAGGFHLSPRTTKKGDSQHGAVVPGVVKFAAPPFLRLSKGIAVPLADCVADGVDLLVPVSGVFEAKP
jgi:hypothetical protein